eukprot:TRINITY_DN34786_c0_g1_i1.p3 TRINITY_DN34786_c0_g1~~TRINITY_DN34786_c0_g1_i1.p3  ORF type:complete len:117 (-),score=11.10 TRINITY_DN34786_c0_g1_i1:101-451(-)
MYYLWNNYASGKVFLRIFAEILIYRQLNMTKIANKLTELIGNTPLLKLSAYMEKYNSGANVLGKLEYFNPAGSVKDRAALSMIEDAEARGILKPGATIIDPCTCLLYTSPSPRDQA